MEKYIEIDGIDASTYAGKAARACKIKARGVMGDEFVVWKLLDFVNLMLLNTKFAGRGITVTEDNREECYIKIIESGDESLITDLEKYIQLLDNIKTIEKYRDEYTNIVDQLKCLENPNDEEKVNSIVEGYLRK